MRSRTRLYALGTLLIVGFAGFAFAAFRETLTPYVSYEQARGTERMVQVAGGLAPGSSSYDSDTQVLSFSLVDEATGELLPVDYEGIKPGNFEEAISIVAIGRWDEPTEAFHADKLLVKCPSKYQGLEEEKEYG